MLIWRAIITAIAFDSMKNFPTPMIFTEICYYKRYYGPIAWEYIFWQAISHSCASGMNHPLHLEAPRNRFLFAALTKIILTH